MATTMWRNRNGWLAAAGIALWLAGEGLRPLLAADADSPKATARRVLAETGVQGGLIVHLGCGDGKLTAALHDSDSFLVQGLDTDPECVAAARRYIRQLGLYGPVTADRLAGSQLPYIDNLVNLIVASDCGPVSMDEIMRVLCPGGIAYVKQPDGWTKKVKPRPDGMDDWSHYLHDSSNNAVSHDRLVGPPKYLQWVGSPRYSRHHDHMSSVNGVVSAGGRLFYIFDEGSRASILLPPHWSLIARDAFNGTILWKRPIKRWHTHLWPLKSGPAQLPRRLVADGQRVYVTLGIDAPLSALEAATGKTVRTYKGTEATLEVILSDGVLFLLVDQQRGSSSRPDLNRRRAARRGVWQERPRQVMAVQADTGKLLWSVQQPILPGTLAADAQRVVFHDGQCIVCLDRRTGQERWRSEPVPRSREIRSFYLPTLVLYQDVVLFSGGETAGLQTGSWYESGQDTLTALSAQTGKVLWSAYHPPSGYRSPEDLLVVGGLVWSGETTSGRAVGVFAGRDPQTGEVKSKFAPDVKIYWFHHRCYRGKATDRYLLTSRAGIEFIDVRNRHWMPHHWVRGACLYGIMPANGLIYAPQHPCACYLESKLDGFNALAAGGVSKATSGAGSASPASRSKDAGRLQPGPAYSDQGRQRTGAARSQSREPEPNGWPTYRHDAARSGFTKEPVPAELHRRWARQLGGRLSAPVIADGKLFVASVDEHALYALDAGSGKQLWQFTAGGRIDSPPTFYRGLVLFGSADGCVYCLRASDGALAWRFRAAPAERRLVAFEQLESVWPVPGSVLVQDGVAYCVAGRSMFLDGGLLLWRLDTATGKVLSQTVLDDRDRATGKDLLAYVSWLNMPAAKPDVLSSDGRFVYMRSQPFRLDGTRLPLEPMARGPDADRGAPPPIQQPQYAHLFCPTGFLDDSAWHRSYWMYGSTFISGWEGYYRAGKAAPAGRILVFDDDRVYGYGRKPKYYRWTTPIEYQLFAAPKRLPDWSKSRRAGPVKTCVRVEKSASLNPAGKPLTVAAWVNPQQTGGVILARGGSAHGYALYARGGRLHFALRADGKGRAVVSKERIVGRWTHVAGVLTADKKMLLYVDGKLSESAKAPGLLPADPAEPMEIGADDNSSVGPYFGPFGFNGLIDEVRVYRRALSAEQIAGLAARSGPAPKQQADLVLYCPFDDGTAADASGNGNDGKVEGAVAVAGKQGQALKFAGGPERVPGYAVRHDWTAQVPMFVRAMVLADRTLFIAGPPDVVDEEQAAGRIQDPAVQAKLAEQETALAGAKGGLLWAVAAADGRKLSECRLNAPPVFDGMAAAYRCLFIADQGGTVLCLGPQQSAKP